MSLIIFDFDGTIADSFEYVFGFLRKEAGKSETYAKKPAQSFRGLCMKDMALGLGIPFWRLPFLYFRGRRVMRSHILHIKPFAGMSEVVRTLHDNGHTLCVVSSNSTRNIHKFLRQHDLDDCFSAVRGGAGILGKVTPIKQLRMRYKVNLDDCWYVGDEITDIASAKAVGIRSLAVTWGFASPDKLSKQNPTATATSPAQIIDIIK